jgi:hypothetical protein
MCTRPLSAALAAILMTASSLSIAQAPEPQDPKQATQPADQAQLKKQCEDMKKQDMSKMSAAEHEAMMKKCQNLDKKQTRKSSPGDTSPEK